MVSGRMVAAFVSPIRDSVDLAVVISEGVPSLLHDTLIGGLRVCEVSLFANVCAVSDLVSEL